MRKPITLAGFDSRFSEEADPWSTWTGRDEAVKRRAILHASGSGIGGRVLELGAGNGSNSAALAPRARVLDATEATTSGTDLVASAIGGWRGARAIRLVVPGRLPRPSYERIVIAELLYYLTPQAMAITARDIARALAPGGVVVLAHHRIDFHDFAQHADSIHDRFLRDTGVQWRRRVVRRNRRWIVEAARRL